MELDLSQRKDEIELCTLCGHLAWWEINVGGVWLPFCKDCTDMDTLQPKSNEP